MGERSTGLPSRFREACACGWKGWGIPGAVCRDRSRSGYRYRLGALRPPIMGDEPRALRKCENRSRNRHLCLPAGGRVHSQQPGLLDYGTGRHRGWAIPFKATRACMPADTRWRTKGTILAPCRSIWPPKHEPAHDRVLKSWAFRSGATPGPGDRDSNRAGTGTGHCPTFSRR